MDEIIAKIYASLVNKNIKTINGVPEPLRKRVLELCEQIKVM